MTIEKLLGFMQRRSAQLLAPLSQEQKQEVADLAGAFGGLCVGKKINIGFTAAFCFAAIILEKVVRHAYEEQKT